MNAIFLRHRGWLVVFTVLQLWALRCSALSKRSSDASGRISLVESSLSAHCIGSAAHKCFSHLVYEANGSSLTLTPSSASCQNFGQGQGKIVRNQALGHFEHSLEGGLRESFALSRATAKSVPSDDITVADMVIWELSLSFVFGLETCSGRYKVTDGDHLLGVTPEGTLSRPSAPAVLSADDLKLIGFLVAVIAFMLVQYALVALTPPRQSTQMMQHQLTKMKLEAYQQALSSASGSDAYAN